MSFGYTCEKESLALPETPEASRNISIDATLSPRRTSFLAWLDEKIPKISSLLGEIVLSACKELLIRVGYYPKVIPSVKVVLLAGTAKNFLLYGSRRNVSSFENRASIHANFELGAADSPVN